jgi:hypothetical protein
MRESVDEAERAFQENVVNPAWKKFEAGPDVQVSVLNDAVKDALESFNEFEKKELIETFGKDIEGLNTALKQGQTTASPETVKNWLSVLREKAYDVSDPVKGATSQQRRLRDLITKVEDAFAAGNDAFREAKNQTATKYARFRGDRMTAARRGEPEQFTSRLIGSGPENAAIAARMLRNTEDPAIINQGFDALASRATARDGTVNVTDTFINDNRAILEALPENLAQPFYRANETGKAGARLEQAAKRAREGATATARTEGKAIGEATVQREGALKQALKAAEEATTAGRREVEGLSKSRLAQFARDPATEVRKLLSGGAENAQELERVTRLMDDAGELDAFRGLVREELDQKFLSGNYFDESGRLNDSVRPRDAREFQATVKRLEQAGTIDADQSNRIVDAFNRSMTLEQRAKSLSNYAAPNTGEFVDLIASGAAAALVGALSGTQTLLVGGAVRRNIKRYLQGKSYKREEVALLEQMVLDPETWIRELDNYAEVSRMTDPDKIATAMFRPLERFGRLGQITAGPDEEE